MNTSRLETIEQKYINMAKTIQTVKQNPKNSRKRKKINIGGLKEKKRGFHRVSIWVHNNATTASLAAKIVFSWTNWEKDNLSEGRTSIRYDVTNCYGIFTICKISRWSIVADRQKIMLKKNSFWCLCNPLVFFKRTRKKSWYRGYLWYQHGRPPRDYGDDTRPPAPSPCLFPQYNTPLEEPQRIMSDDDTTFPSDDTITTYELSYSGCQNIFIDYWPLLSYHMMKISIES